MSPIVIGSTRHYRMGHGTFLCECRFETDEMDWADFLMNRFGLPRHVVHQQVLPKRVGSREVSLAAAHLGYFLDELDEAILRCQHEGIDQHARALALRNFLECLADDERIQSERILVNASIF